MPEASKRTNIVEAMGFILNIWKEWKQHILTGLQPSSIKENKTEHRQVILENKTLKRELHRKEKALSVFFYGYF